MDIKLKEARDNGVKGGRLMIVADGYNAPITAGNFIDLVNRKFYDDMEVQRADGFVVQTGNPGPPVCPASHHLADPCITPAHAVLVAACAAAAPFLADSQPTWT